VTGGWDSCRHRDYTDERMRGDGRGGERERRAPYLAYTFGKVPWASRSRIGVTGLFFFMMGYARVRNVLSVRKKYELREV